MKITKTLIAGLTTALLLTGCTNGGDSATQEELAALRLEIERLTNEIGRLEFRVYELENRPTDAPGATAPEKTRKADQDSGQPAGEFDLTPVE